MYLRIFAHLAAVSSALILTVNLTVASTEALPESVTYRDAVQADRDSDLVTAFRYFHVLARLGDDRAQFNLGTFYINGEITDVDMVRGLSWMLLANKGRAMRSREIAIGKVAANLTEIRIREARQRAAQMYSEYGSGKRKDVPVSVVFADLANTNICERLVGSRIKQCGKMIDRGVLSLRRTEQIYVYGNR